MKRIEALRNLMMKLTLYATGAISEETEEQRTVIEGYGKIYDENPVQIHQILTDSDVGKSEFTWQEMDSEGEFIDMKPGINPVNAGKYRIVLMSKNDIGYREQAIAFEIKKDTRIVMFDITKSPVKSYDGHPADIPPILMSGSRRDDIKVTWEKLENDRYVKLDQAPIDVGIYKITAKIPGDRNHEEALDTAIYTILP